MRLGVSSALALALLLVPREPAQASEPSEPGAPHGDIEHVALTYHVADGCPDQAAFVSAIEARTRRAHFDAQTTGTRRFVVDIERKGANFAGRLVVEQGTSRATREVTSTTCKEVVEAFVLVTVIAIDPSASLSPVATPPPPPPPEEVPPAPPSAPTESTEAPSPPREAPSAGNVGARQRPKSPKKEPAPEWHLRAGAGAFVATGIADSAMISAHPVIDFASTARGLSPSVRLGLVWANSSAQPAYPGQVVFGLRTLVLSGCAVRIAPWGERLPSARICGAFEGGVLAVRPYGLERATSPDRPWFAAGPLVRFDLPIVDRLSLSADAGLALPFERERVYSLAGPTVTVVEAVQFRLAVSALLRAF
ncbi:hypothetical protein AKJ09_04405 [Labilithrix luteola]|uniref:Uncharacterized protein n=1 Tax=Labilithrix luteola TaxID=1391654 RepID=A0A0K1PWJ5_9BACT|nr:hypothetical protein [Labilithrix luteola]AKU97741.1 hypothetical protein AKJ09_04405 [Labilithrix luteola]